MSCKVLQVVNGEIRLGIQVCLTQLHMVSIAHGIHGTRDRRAHSQHQTGQLQGAGTKCLRAWARRVQAPMSESWKGTVNLCIQVILIIVLTCPHLGSPV